MALLMPEPGGSVGRAFCALAYRWLKPRFLAGLLGLLCCVSPVRADTLEEYRLKVAFIYNFVSFTEWPAGLGDTLNLCVYGADPFGEELDKLQGRSVAGRSLAVRRTASLESLATCQIVFIARPMIANLPRVLDNLKGKPVLTVSDSPGAARQGVALNMLTEQSRIQFEANPVAARDNGLLLSSKLLRLAREVYQ
jgi:hypothetical protein